MNINIENNKWIINKSKTIDPIIKLELMNKI